jgi:hypothetical protein
MAYADVELVRHELLAQSSDQISSTGSWSARVEKHASLCWLFDRINLGQS